MDFIRFSGELFIYYVLIALGGGRPHGVHGMIFKAIGINVGRSSERGCCPAARPALSWSHPGWWKRSQSVIENMAPMLTRLFTPMFAAMLIMFLAILLWTGRGIDVTRDVLIAFDLLLVVVIAFCSTPHPLGTRSRPPTPSM